MGTKAIDYTVYKNCINTQMCREGVKTNMYKRVLQSKRQYLSSVVQAFGHTEGHVWDAIPGEVPCTHRVPEVLIVIYGRSFSCAVVIGSLLQMLRVDLT